MSKIDWGSYKGLSYEDFRARALDPSLSPHEKIGFPRIFREGKEAIIFQDILSKLRNLRGKEKRVLDIGAGCSGLASELVAHSLAHRHSLMLMDSREMLDLLSVPSHGDVEKVPGHFPFSPESFVSEFREKLDIVLCYSVLHGTFLEMNPFRFLDAAVSLLSPGGELLIGDLPNVSKRNRFFSSETGIKFHKEFMKTEELPHAQGPANLQEGGIDDSIIFSILQRYRSFGMETYLLPQAPELPMANRREDILIRRN